MLKIAEPQAELLAGDPLTTVAGLFSLATGLGGKSLLWGPVASSIMWGLGVATIMTLFVIPLIYRAGMARARK